MKYIKYIYYVVFMTMSCYCANGPDQKSEISPRDQDQSLRKKNFLERVDLRKAIANSSPRRDRSREDIAPISAYLAYDLESPRTRLKKSQSANFSPQRDNKTLRDVISLEEGSSPRGENIVLTLLRIKGRQNQEANGAENFREKSSAPKVVNFQHSSPDPKLLILMGESEKLSSNKKYEHTSASKVLSAEDQALIEQGVCIEMSLLDDLFPKGESSSSKSEIGSESK